MGWGMEVSKKSSKINNITSASALAAPIAKLSSGIPGLDHFLKGGIPIGLSEWGIPPGYNERRIFLSFIATTNALSLWIHPAALRIYPPAWAAQGIDLTRMRFVSCANPLQNLKPILMSSTFKLLFFDNPEKLSVADCAFLAHRARLQHQCIILIRHYRLSNKRGNIWAGLRVNCTQTTGDTSTMELTGLRGTQVGKCLLRRQLA